MLHTQLYQVLQKMTNYQLNGVTYEQTRPHHKDTRNETCYHKLAKIWNLELIILTSLTPTSWIKICIGVNNLIEKSFNKKVVQSKNPKQNFSISSGNSNLSKIKAVKHFKFDDWHVQFLLKSFPLDTYG